MRSLTGLTPPNSTTAHIQEDTLKGWLQEQLSQDRFYHSLGAQKKALELARQFKLSDEEIQKSGIAGLTHDAAKLMTPEALFEACQNWNIELSEDDRLSVQTLHPFVGAEMLRRDFKLEDEDILNAIRYHTTGRAGMSRVELIVYIADKIEENTRNPLYTQKIMALVDFNDLKTLNRAALYIMDSTITFLIEKGQPVHPRTLQARNDLVRLLKKENIPVQYRKT